MILHTDIQIGFTNKNYEVYDHVVCACHANETGDLLSKLDIKISKLLKKFRYSSNKVFLHSDKRLMPLKKSIWASWNYLSIKRREKNIQCFSYWMNKLQNIDKKYLLFLTLNPPFTPRNIFYKTTYTHPIFTNKTMSNFSINIFILFNTGYILNAGSSKSFLKFERNL